MPYFNAVASLSVLDSTILNVQYFYTYSDCMFLLSLLQEFHSYADEVMSKKLITR